ncbi:MAG: slipin family protein [Betaproteobacteria bacterium]|nr:MAG: slipin family protein [Betaproteobacteria bacterium]
MVFGIGFGGIVLIVFLLLVGSFRVLREYQRAVVFMLGRFWKVKGPGLILIIPGVQQMVRVDLRTIVMDVPPQDVITRDNVSVKVDAVIYFRVVDPAKSVIQVEKFLAATSYLAQTTLRAILGKHALDELLSEREKLNLDIQRVLDTQTDAWGIKVTTVEIKQVDLNESMIRAIARRADARQGAAGDAAALPPDARQHRRRQELDHRFSGAAGAALRAYRRAAAQASPLT